jgi:hypothetical protein
MSNVTVSFPAQWKFTPITAGAKNPIGKGWQDKPLTWEEIFPLFSNTYQGVKVGAIGCLSGEMSGGLLFVDHDGHSCDTLIESWGNELPETWRVDSGRGEGHYQLAYWVPEIYWPAIETRKYRTGEAGPDGKPELLELRWNGCQSLIFGAHPSGSEYRWQCPGEIATAPLWVIEKMLKAEEEHPQQVQRATQQNRDLTRWTSVEWANSFLNAIDPSGLDWYTWRDCLFAAHSAGCSEMDVLQWSRQSHAHTEQGFSDVWRHIKGKSGKSVGIGTLGYLAKQAGWTSPFPKKEEVPRDLVKKAPTGPAIETNPISLETVSNRAQALKLEIKKYLAEGDSVARLIIRGDICARYRISKQDFTEQVCQIEADTETREKYEYDGESFFEEESEALRFYIPRYLPVAESILLCAPAGVGKSNLVADELYSGLTGEAFLDEEDINPFDRALYVGSDESVRATRRRFKARGIDTIPNIKNRMHFWSKLDILNLVGLEKKLEDFRPQVVFIDSITSICMEVGISEKDPEFARYLYKLKATIERYGASCVILHHSNKDPLAKGLSRVSGSARIPAAFWGVFLLDRKADNPESPFRILELVKGREIPEFKTVVAIQDRQDWGYGIYKSALEDEEEIKVKSNSIKVLEVLREFSPKGLEFSEIDEKMRLGKSLYRILDRLEDNRLITKRRSAADKRRWVYSVDSEATPPPLKVSIECEQYAESYTGYGKNSSHSTFPLGENNGTISGVQTTLITDLPSHPISKLEEEEFDFDLHGVEILGGGNKGCEENSLYPVSVTADCSHFPDSQGGGGSISIKPPPVKDATPKTRRQFNQKVDRNFSLSETAGFLLGDYVGVSNQSILTKYPFLGDGGIIEKLSSTHARIALCSEPIALEDLRSMVETDEASDF